MGDAGGIVAALIYATVPVVAQTEASALQEPFVNVFVLLAVVVWAGLQLSHGLLYFALSMLDDGYALTVAVMAALVEPVTLGAPFELVLEGPAGGKFSQGVGGERVEIDAIEFVRVLSGRRPGTGVLSNPLPL